MSQGLDNLRIDRGDAWEQKWDNYSNALNSIADLLETENNYIGKQLLAELKKSVNNLIGLKL